MHVYDKILGENANSIDPDQTAPEQSDLDLYCLHMPLFGQVGVQNFKTFTVVLLTSAFSILHSNLSKFSS